MNQPAKLRAIIGELRASEAKMKEPDHIGFGMLCIFLFFFPLFCLIDGHLLISFLSSLCLATGIVAYYWISTLCVRHSWHWESVTKEFHGKTLQQMWNQCERGDWLLWFCSHMIGRASWPTHQQLVLVSCQCARLEITHVKPGENRPLKVIETTEAWARGEATEEEVRNAVSAMYPMDRDDVTYIATEAVKSAAWAVYVNEDGDCFRLAQAISGAAIHSAWAAKWAVGFSSPEATRDDAEKMILRESANIVRRILTIPKRLTNELRLYRWVKRWHTTCGRAGGSRTGRMSHIPVAVSGKGASFVVTGAEIGNGRLKPAVRLTTGAFVVAAALLLLGALQKNPSQYYVVLRWATCAAAAMLVWRGSLQGSLKWAYALVPVAILFNPVVPVHLHGTVSHVLKTWHTLDVAAMVVMVSAVCLMEAQVIAASRNNRSRNGDAASIDREETGAGLFFSAASH